MRMRRFVTGLKDLIGNAESDDESVGNLHPNIKENPKQAYFGGLISFKQLTKLQQIEEAKELYNTRKIDYK